MPVTAAVLAAGVCC